MFNLIKNAISNGGYKLSEIQYKIKKLFLLGDLTEKQMDELLTLASGGVSTDAERPETLAMIQTLAAEIEALKARVLALESAGGESSGDDTTDPEQPAYPAWKPWDGLSSDYQNGAIVSHNGELWLSVFAGQNVWEPGTAGTESLWVKHVAEVSNDGSDDDQVVAE